jgi:hypothetical protein
VYFTFHQRGWWSLLRPTSTPGKANPIIPREINAGDQLKLHYLQATPFSNTVPKMTHDAGQAFAWLVSTTDSCLGPLIRCCPVGDIQRLLDNLEMYFTSCVRDGGFEEFDEEPLVLPMGRLALIQKIKTSRLRPDNSLRKHIMDFFVLVDRAAHSIHRHNTGRRDVHSEEIERDCCNDQKTNVCSP